MMDPNDPPNSEHCNNTGSPMMFEVLEQWQESNLTSAITIDLGSLSEQPSTSLILIRKECPRASR